MSNKPPPQEHPFAPYIRILGKGKRGSRALTQAEARDAMKQILQQQLLPEQLGAFLMLMRVKEETAEELAGFVEAVAAFIQPPSIQVDLDWSSYAGKRRHLPWFILSCLLLADQGVRIFMHGSRGHTAGRLYTEDVLQTLGLGVCQDWRDVEQHLKRQNLAFMPLAQLCNPLEEIIQMRHRLGLRSPVHSLARLLNPLRAQALMQGIFHPGYQGIHQQAARLLGYAHCCVIKGEGGEIERNPDISLETYELHQDQCGHEQWPAYFNKRHVKPEQLEIHQLLALWRGTMDEEYGQGAVLSTAALALRLLGRASSPEEALSLAQQAWQARSKTLI